MLLDAVAITTSVSEQTDILMMEGSLMRKKLFALLAVLSLSMVPFGTTETVSAQGFASEGEAHIMACSGSGFVGANTPVYEQKSVTSPVIERYGPEGMHYVRGFIFDDGWVARDGFGWIQVSDFIMFECNI